MTRLFVYILLGLMPGIAGAQQAEVTERLNTQVSQPLQIHATPGGSVSAIPVVPGYESCRLVLEQVTESHMGTHYLYRQVFRNMPVYGSMLKLSTDKKGNALSSFHTLIRTEELDIRQPASITSDPSACWVVSGSSLLPASMHTEGQYFMLKQENGSVLYKQDQRLYFTDTTVKAMVFNPDPLTTAGVTYGTNGTYRHFNDSDYALLNDQRQLKSFPATFRNDTFFLANKYSVIRDKEAPFSAPSVSLTGEFFFTRSKTGFKEVMAMYHIYAIQLYLQSLGFNNLVNYQLKVDPHASTADQSFFSYSEGDTLLKFGLGGIPDAEDADVIVHEYSHAISFSLNSNGITSAERRALEEGLCDAISCIYSKRLNPFGWRKIFGWDGHNEFWDGRNGSSGKTYDNKIGDAYSDSEIWSSAMNNLAETIGEDAVMRLMLASIPQFTPFTTMPQAARLMYNADSILHNKLNQGYLALEFNARKFDSFPVGLNDVLTDQHITISSSMEFAQGTGNLSILTRDGGSFTAELYDLNGRKLVSFAADGNMELSPAGLKGGLYVMHITMNGREGYYKLARY